MRKRNAIVVAMTLGLAGAGCGGAPVLAGAPKPDPAVVAGAAAAVAGAATLADPKGQAARVEANKPVEDKKPVRVKESVPSGVLDRLDEKRTGGTTDAAPAPAPAHGSDDPDGTPFDQPK